MNRPLEVMGGAVIAIRDRLFALTGQPERTVMLGTILIASTVSAVTGYVLTQCFSVDVLSSLLFIPQDCWLDWGMNIGRHCFGDYAMVVDPGIRPNPWDAYPLQLPPDYQPLRTELPPAAMIPNLLFGLPAKWLGAPRLGLLGYLFALTIAVVSPAIWAARGARGLERVIVFVALGAAAIPAWAVIDRGNSVGFVAPIALVFLVALCRQRWGLVTIMAVLAALVKPPFVVLAVALFAARQWRWGSLAIVGTGLSSLGAYLLWPRDFPNTIPQSFHNLVHYGTFFPGLVDLSNVSFGRALLLLPDAAKASQTGGEIPDGFLAGTRSLLGYAVLLLVVVSVLALGRRIPPIMVGIVLLASAAFFPPQVHYYYLIFVLPVAALVARCPGGPPGAGIFESLATHGDRRRAAGICVSLAAALSIAQVAIPVLLIRIPIFGQLGAKGVIGKTLIVSTTAPVTPILWLLACTVITVSYARRPALTRRNDPEPPREALPLSKPSHVPGSRESTTGPDVTQPSV
ncbi:MAG: hypothetical protein QOJ56_3278 [Mycobacterium sp.]|nr:hypothetical protein [Mycobacterium sp.]